MHPAGREIYLTPPTLQIERGVETIREARPFDEPGLHRREGNTSTHVALFAPFRIRSMAADPPASRETGGMAGALGV